MTTIPSGQPEIKIGEWITEGWEIFVSDVGMFLLAGLIFTILNSICFPIFLGPLSCGMFLMIFDRMQGGKADIKRLFSGFDFFGPAFVAGLIFFLLYAVGMIVTVIGLMLLVIPGLIGLALLVLLETAFLFVFQLIAHENMGATDAISASFEKVKTNLWGFLLFGLVIFLINWAGYSIPFACLATIPLTMAASAAAYRDVFGIEDLNPDRI